MNAQPDGQIPAVAADNPGEHQDGDYLAPPRLLPRDTMTTARSIALVLLVGTGFIQGEKTVNVTLKLLPIGSSAWLFKVAVGVGVLGLQGLAIFKNRVWTTRALWLALGAVLIGMSIQGIL